MTGIELGALARGLGRVRGDASVRVSGVKHDSRDIERGDLFVAIVGEKHDAAAFVDQAVARGAVAIATDRDLPTRVPAILVDDARRALAPLAHRAYGDPTRALRVVGVTGTNGKTTTTHLVEEMLATLGATPALLGTIVFRMPGSTVVAPHTTPEADVIARFASEASDRGASHLVMEVSSHGLTLHRADSIHFEVAGFTNLTQDHLDFHGTFEEYGNAKAKLFFELEPASAVVTVDDEFGKAIADRFARERPGVPLLRSSTRGEAAELRVIDFESSASGIVARVATPAGEVELRSPLVGRHNLENLLVALGSAMLLGYPVADAVRALEPALGAPGRLERVADPRGVNVLVDYAHTPDALDRVLAALRPLTTGRLIAVFGCGGDRDRDKRPKMGRAAGSRADLCVVTSDNPRTEDPNAIVAAIVPGVEEAGQRSIGADDLAAASSGFVVEVDREKAIGLALAGARRDDTVLIAGKGHEDYQIVGTEKRSFDDRKIAASAIARAGGAA
jgi:UDP-N-acetylmuramoyl-L-alanyl-D-glutamate--2,6-diaminopimelate ligase